MIIKEDFKIKKGLNLSVMSPFVGGRAMDTIYFQLRACFLKREEQGKVYFKLAELSELWLCTIKQAKRRLQRYQEENKLIYIPGIGRGNLSELIFNKTFQKEVEEIVEKALRENSLTDVMELLQMDIPKEWFDQVFQEIQEMFGARQNEGNQDTLRYILRRPITSLNPLYTAVSRESFMIRQLGDTLVAYDERHRKLKPGLAHHWRISNDCKTWTFFLRKGVRFHHGRTLNSEDVRHSLMRAKQPESVVFWQLQNLEEIECPDEYTVTVKLRKSEPFFGHYVSSGNLVILPADVLFDENKWISTGPFRIREYSNRKIVLEAFDDYYSERPLMDRIEFWVVENDSLPITVLAEETYSEEDEYIEQSRQNNGVDFLIFNFHRKSPVQHPKFREAMFHLFDAVAMEGELQLGAGQFASCYYPELSVVQKKISEKIPELLKAAGYQGETLILGIFNYLNGRREGRWLQKRAAEYGIDLKIREMMIDQAFYTKEFEEETDMMLLGDIPPANQEMGFIDFCCNPNLLCQRFYSKQILSSLNRKIEKMKFCENYEERLLEYQKIDSWLTDNYFLVYLFHPVKKELIHSAIEYRGNDLFSSMNLRSVWAERTKRKLS